MRKTMLLTVLVTTLITLFGPAAYAQGNAEIESLRSRVAELENRLAGNKTTVQLIEDLRNTKDDGWQLRFNAAKELGNRKALNAVSSLTSIIQSEKSSSSMKKVCITALAQIAEDHQDTQAVLELLSKSTDVETKTYASAAVTAIKDKRAAAEALKNTEVVIPKKPYTSKLTLDLDINFGGGTMLVYVADQSSNEWSLGGRIGLGVYVVKGLLVGLQVPFYFSKPEGFEDVFIAIQGLLAVSYSLDTGTNFYPFLGLGLGLGRNSAGELASTSFALQLEAGCKYQLGDNGLIKLGAYYNQSFFEVAGMIQDLHRINFELGYVYWF
jgi:opacity protein-like surface antigen